MRKSGQIYGLLPGPVTALVALLLPSLAMPATDTPPLTPTRDVDITYDVTRPQKPPIRERVRWLAAEHLERVDGTRGSTTIFDRSAHDVTLLTPANRTYRKLESAPRRPLEPDPGAKLTRAGAATVAGLQCTNWSWTEDTEVHTVCATADGVPLRLIVDGRTVMAARSVKYGPQPPALFQVPKDYTPALAPEGGPAAE